MSHDCYIVGNGASLVGFDFDRLGDAVRIGADYAAFLGGCDMLCSMNSYFISMEPEIIISFGKKAYIRAKSAYPFYPTSTPFRRVWCGGFARAPGFLQGLTSEYAALNLAVKLGFKDIALLGCDFRIIGGLLFFHGADYDDAQHMYTAYHYEFDRAAPVAEALGIRITNYVGPYGSAITALPTRPLETLQ